MKRKGNLFNQVCSLENLQLADQRARSGKEDQYGVKLFDLNAKENLSELRDMLLYKEYTTSKYSIMKICDPKERDVYRLPYYPDRIVHHAVMSIAGPILDASLTADTYAGIKGRGIHAAHYAIKRALLDYPGTRYCLQIDIRKFYPNIDHSILKYQLRRKIKDPDLLWLLDDIIDSAPGLPIGNYLSQSLSNFNLSPFDHWIKEEKRVRYYFRYCDDMAILAGTKEELHRLLYEIRIFLKEQLNLDVKGNYQIFPVDDQGINMLGYEYRHNYIRIRKRIKENFARAVAKGKSHSSIAAFYGWCKHANTNHLMKKLLNHEQLQRLRGGNRNKKLFGGKDKHPQPAEYRNNCRRLSG